VIYTGNNQLLLKTSSNSNRSETSSPCSTTNSIITTPSSPYRPNSSLASLIITTKQDEVGVAESNKMDSAVSNTSSSRNGYASLLLPPPPPPPPLESSLSNLATLPQKIIPLFPQTTTTAIQTNLVKISKSIITNIEDENKYTFIPIQLPHKRLSGLSTSTSNQVNNANLTLYSSNNQQSPVNIGDSSPASIDSPLVNTSDNFKLAADSEFSNQSQQQQQADMTQIANNSGCSTESSFLS
jgi:hypothetical protein